MGVATAQFTQGSIIGGDGQSVFGFAASTVITMTDAGGSGATYLWEIISWPAPLSSPPSITNSTLQSATVTPTLDGVYIVRLTRTEGMTVTTDVKFFGVDDADSLCLPSAGQSGNITNSGGTPALSKAAGWMGRQDAGSNRQLDAYLRYAKTTAKQAFGYTILAKGASTGNVALTGALTQDGVTYSTGQLFFAKDQTLPAQNGLWVVNTSGTWTRSSNCDTTVPPRHGMVVRVESGTTNVGKEYILATTGAITVDATGLSFVLKTLQANVRFIGAKGDGSTNDRTALLAAHTSSNVVVYPAGSYLVGSNATLGTSSTVHRFERGARLYSDTGVTVTIAGYIEAPSDQKIFDGPGSFLIEDTAEFFPEWFGALGDGSTDDGPAIRRAIAALKQRGGGTLRLRETSYLLDSEDAPSGSESSGGLVVDFSNFALVGEGRGKSILIEDPASNAGFIPILVQKWDTGDFEPTEISNISIRGLTVFWPGNGPNDDDEATLGSIHLGACAYSSVMGVTILGDGAGQGESLCDGLVYAWGSRDGFFEDVVVQGLSNSGFNLEYCERIHGKGIARNCFKDPDVDATGATGLAFRIMRDCNIEIDSHGHNGSGIVGTVFSTSALGTVANLSNQTHFQVSLPFSGSAFYVARLGVLNTTTKLYEELEVDSFEDTGDQATWDIVLTNPPSQMLSNGMDILSYYPSRNNTLNGSTHNNTLYGLVLQAPVSGTFHESITLNGLQLHDNSETGASIVAVNGLVITGALVSNNSGGGLTISDTDVVADVEQVTRGISIGGGTQFKNNTVFDLFLQSARDVTVASDTIFATKSGAVPILLATISGGVRNKNISIGRFLHPEYSSDLVANLTDVGDTVTDGIYDLDLTDTPESAQYAPLGSTAVDRTTGFRYVKNTAGTSNTGWKRVYAQSDSPEFAGLNVTGLTASYAVITDGSKNLASLVYGSGIANGLAQYDSNRNLSGQYFICEPNSGVVCTTGAAGLQCQIGSAVFLGAFGGTTFMSLDATNVTLGTPNIKFGTTLTPTISQDIRGSTGVNAGAALTISAQQGQNASGGTNNNGGDLVLQAGAIGTGGSGGAAGGVKFYQGASHMFSVENYPGSPTIAYVHTGAAANFLWFDSSGGLQFTAGSTINMGAPLNLLGVGTGVDVWSFSAASSAAATLTVGATITGTTINQADNTTNSATAAPLTLQAQSATGTTSTGGSLVLASGAGTSAPGSVTVKAGSTSLLQLSSTSIAPQISTFGFATGVSSPVIRQDDNTTNSATAQTLTIFSQAATGTSSTGGNLSLRAGGGTSANGSVFIRSGSSGAQIEVNANKLGFFGASPVIRPTGVAATGPGVHAALVTLGLITA